MPTRQIASSTRAREIASAALEEFYAHAARTRAGLSYVDIGTGPAAVFVHGVGTSSYLWRNVIAGMKHQRRCIALDLPLHGRSSTQSDLTLPGLVETLHEFCRDAGLAEFDLVANDTGGAIAQIFAVRHPDRLRTLTLTNCDVHHNLPPAALRPTVALAAAGQLAPLLAAALDDPELAVRGALNAGYQCIHSPTELVEAFLRPLFGTPQAGRAFERMLVGLAAAPLIAIQPKLSVLAVPTLIVWGTDDPFFNMDWANWLHDTIPGATDIVQIAGGRLFFPDERAPELVAALRRHWATSRARPNRDASTSREENTGAG